MEPINKVFYSSCTDMYQIPDNHVNLIITSPPYFNIKDYSKDWGQENTHSKKSKYDVGSIDNYDEFMDTLRKLWIECERVLKPNGKLIVNAPLMPMPKKSLSTHYNRDIFNIYGDIESTIVHGVNNMYLMNVYIWNRTNSNKALMFGSYPYPHNFYSQNTCEFIGVFVKGGEPEKVDKEIKEMSILTQEEWILFTKQVWDLPTPTSKDSGGGFHPAVMPEEIVRRCVRLYSFVGDIVMDPFTGSGTTLKVAKELGRNYLGYELYETYKGLIDSKLASTNHLF